MSTTPAVLDLRETMLDDLDRALETLTLGATRLDPRPRLTATGFHDVLACAVPGHDADRVLAWAQAVARMDRARVHVATVVPPPPSRPPLGRQAEAWWGEILDAQSGMARGYEGHAHDAASRLRAAGVEADAMVGQGSPAPELARMARTRHADLVVLGGARPGPVGGTLLGTVADAVATRTSASVLIARGQAPARAILLATDGSASSRHATAAAARLAAAFRARLDVLHVVESFAPARAHPNEDDLRGLVEEMRLPTPRDVAYHLDVGRPAQRILHHAEARGADLVVVGARGLGHVGGLLLGSVSHRVASAAPQSVLVVREPA